MIAFASFAEPAFSENATRSDGCASVIAEACKRKGDTDTPGTRAEKQDALALTEQMMKVYDKSVPTVKPSA